MNRFKFASNAPDIFPNGLRKYQVLSSRSNDTILVCLRHYRGLTKCARWNKPGSVIDGKTFEPLKSPYSIAYIFDKWVADQSLFKPFEIGVRNLFKHPRPTLEAIKLLRKAKKGKLNEVD